MFCNCNNEIKGNEKLSNIFPILNNASDSSFIYVIPGSGCNGCITEAESLALNYKNSDSIYFVFTRIHSKKLFTLKFPSLVNSTNVILDTSNLFVFPEHEKDIYPILFQKINSTYSIIRHLKP